MERNGMVCGDCLSLRAACELSEGHAIRSLKDEDRLQDIYAVKNEQVYKTAHLPEAIKQFRLKPERYAGEPNTVAAGF